MQMTKFSTCPNLSPTLCPLYVHCHLLVEYLPIHSGRFQTLNLSSNWTNISLFSQSWENIFSLSLYLPTVFILLTVSLYALFSFVFKVHTTVSVSFCISSSISLKQYSFPFAMPMQTRSPLSWTFEMASQLILLPSRIHDFNVLCMVTLDYFPNTSGSASKRGETNVTHL